MSNSRGRLISLPLALALALALATAACAAGSSGTSAIELPNLTLTAVGDSGGGDLDLQQTGRDRVLNLWAVWCAPCLEELPVFDDVAKLTTDVDVIGINVGDTANDAQTLIDELGLTFQQVLDPSSKVRTELRITGMPATIFVSSTGEVLAVQNGEVDRSELVALINEHFDSGLS